MDAEFNWSQLKLLTPDADKIFGISRSNYSLNEDAVELALRYIAFTHRGDKSPEFVVPPQSFSTETDIMNLRKENVNDWFTWFSHVQNGNVIVVRSYSPLSAISDWKAYIKEKLGEEWETLNTKEFPLDDYLSKADTTGNHDSKGFVNTTNNNVLIFTQTLTTKWKRTFASALFRILREYYPTIESAQQDREFFTALSMLGSSRKVKDSETGESISANTYAQKTLQRLVDNACKDIEFSDYVQAAMLKGFCGAVRKGQIDRLEQDYNNYTSKIHNYEADLANTYSNRDIVMQELSVLRDCGGDVSDEPIIKFFNNHKELKIIKVDNNYSGGKYADYSISSTIEYYDEDEFKRVYNNPNSYMNYNDSIHRFSKRILKGLFSDALGVIRTQCVFRLLNLSGVSARQSQTDTSLRYTHFGHPHLVEYGCLGANGQYIDKYMSQGNWDMAIEQTITASKNLNFGDSTVVSRMMQRLYENRDIIRCIILDDGRELTPNEFYNYLKEIDKQSEVQNNE